MESQDSHLSFEQAFKRLEEILEKMNSSSIALDESLKLYEEADKLIHTCTKRLSTAEKKIEMLIKKRNGELELDENQNPATKEFHLENQKPVK
ncbi:MAG TPA: exodeoxyribonuclease VII small subunit [Parachlamydiaceae bacterium]|nr:exodeoxyribonuclease VII small subunit [Parachlamydiaceae bacterium]